MKNQNLILLTNAFPYGNWEPYLETEVQYYDVFDSVHILSLQVRKEQLNHVRPLPTGKFSVFPILKAAGYIYLAYVLVVLADKNLYIEIKRLFQQKRFSFKRLVKLFIYLSRSHYEARKAVEYLRSTGLFDKDKCGVIYAYRFEYQPYVGLLIQSYLPGFKIIARGHRYDLYEERNSVSYIPMREVLMERLDKVVMISDDGRDYLARKYPSYKNKIIVSRLGTIDYGVKIVDPPNERINIVSCSTIVAVKRLDLIVKSLQLVHSVEVCWTHYGEGNLFYEIKSMCEKKLGSNIHFNFRGFVSNKDLMGEYAREDYHVFINVSASEGIPVSIMEAMSFGTPCIGTNVGGTKEIINHGKNGILLSADFHPEELAGYIREFEQMSGEEYIIYRQNARSSWEENYSADKNYSNFVTNILNNF